MRHGFTTGSCAAAAAKAALIMLFTGSVKESIQIETPKGITFDAQIVDIIRKENEVSCAVVKDGGDDPDITTGSHVIARVWLQEELDQSKQAEVIISGGLGVGRVTKPGLDQPVGEAAINSVPRMMITREVREVAGLFDYKGKIFCEISIPDGVELARKTFNPRLGIEGGISVLGTSGVVEPMSSQALLDTIRVELRQRKALEMEIVPVTPGNYGQDFMMRTYDFNIDRSVKCSNFIGQMIDMSAELGIRKILLTGHIGKLVKVAGGIMNTHSREGDCRMEILAAAAVMEDTPVESVKKVLQSVTTEEAIRILKESGTADAVMKRIMERIMANLRKRADERLAIECMVYSNDHGLLGMSEGALAFLETAIQEQKAQQEDQV